MTTKQRTLKESFKVNGKGLHTGLMIEATFLPAPENHGYKFQRLDMEGQPVIDALAEYVTATTRGTVISRGDLRISTIEHALAALYAAGIDNCLIQLNAPELPILDGSAKVYCEKIIEAGIEEQNADKDFYVVKQKIEVRDDTSGSSIVVLPDDEFSIDTMVSFDSPVLTNQYASLDKLDDFSREIGASRTFVFVREVEPLVKGNLIKGGDLDNAIVIYDSPMQQEELDRLADLMGVPHKNVTEFGYINDFPLLADNEPARHKLLDVLGDIALIGRPMRGKVIATRPGHSINTTFAKKIRKEIKHQELQAPIYNPSVEPLMDVNRIRELLPHRYPFLLVDKIIDKGDNYIVGVKNVTGNEPFFVGHFPQEPVMPGVLQVEAMAQTGGLLVLSTVDDPEKYSTYFMKIDNVKFRNKVVPGDTLIFHVSFMTPLRRGCAIMKGYAFVGEKIVTECEFMAQIVKNK
ncbi:bifunctional UDP-3-O-[3-hydroxymyristoyl] N-acetylglucosamine deacetylase/3-hydroxyacyl-ACP dehydratase [uncultured Muribaculum sp.]|uniref:bifunctional UDP-3-O-[3-hydroxymyristoyl] N-acetylglucosamine deacetylase/3-hydroxyacyl-ACP dehydratase n=8 Tax=uncultured Muribaculum sp. TaxID=1918613 RepID=UPI0025AF2358|nr:bifunctional UDP-3-O-[3-hydroxymyristoyl] N-acetylglucosamine deacetylase/3-hydroxyacyl-ACP dehydratase [uncultured Muribaculum sp.]